MIDISSSISYCFKKGHSDALVLLMNDLIPSH